MKKNWYKRKDREGNEVKMQRFRQDKSHKFLSFDEAKTAFDATVADRKRIKNRSDGTFDVISFKSVKTVEKG